MFFFGAIAEVGSLPRRAATLVAAVLAAGAFGGPDAFAEGSTVSLTAASPQEQGKMVFLRVTASTDVPLESLRMTGTIRVSGATTILDPNREVDLKSGATRTLTLEQSDPDDRRIVRKAMKRGKELVARVRCDFHTDSGRTIIRKIEIALVYVSLN